MFRFMVSKNKDQTIFYQRYLSKGIHFLADLVQILARHSLFYFLC